MLDGEIALGRMQEVVIDRFIGLDYCLNRE